MAAINNTGSAYPSIQSLGFDNTLQNAARGKPQAIPATTFGNISLPTFNKVAAGKLPSAALTIRGLIRGNSQ